jgi:hypothetical protein
MGKHDLPASKAAAEYNLRAATDRGDSVSAAKFEAELQAFEKAIAAAEQRARGEEEMAGIAQMNEQSARAARDMQRMQADTRFEMEKIRQQQQRMEREAEQRKTQQEQQRWMEETRRRAQEAQERINKQARDR